MSKYILLIFCALLPFVLYGQKKESVYSFSDIETIDSLYRRLPDFDYFNIKIEYETKKQILNYSNLTITMKGLNIDSIMIFCSRIKVLSKNNYDPVLIKNLIELLIHNHYIFIGPAGPGDCAGCSTYIDFKKNKKVINSYVLLNKNHYCNRELEKDNCYWPDYPEGEYKWNKVTKVSQRILLSERKLNSIKAKHRAHGFK